MRFGMSMPGIGRRNPWQTSVRYLEMWPFDLLEFVHFWIKDASTIWMVCVLNSNLWSIFHGFQKFQASSGWVGNSLDSQYRSCSANSGFRFPWGSLWRIGAGWWYEYDPMIPSGQKSSMNLGWVSDTPGDFLGWRGCIGNCAGKRENLQVYSLVIFIFFFPKTCWKKIEGWISWNGGYMDKTRWEVANNIANHPPKWGYHQVLSLTFSRLRGVFSAKMVETWKFTTTEVWADLTKPSRNFEKITIFVPETSKETAFLCFFYLMISEITKRLRLNGQTWIKHHKMPNSSWTFEVWFGGPRISECSGMPLAQPGGGGIWISTPKRGRWKPTENNGNCPCVCWWKNRQVTGDASVSVRKGPEAQQNPVTRLRWGPSVKTTFESSNFRKVLYISWIFHEYL